MRSLIQRAGAILSAVSLIAGVCIYLDLRHERKLHERQGVVRLDLSIQSEWQAATAELFRAGTYELTLFTVNRFGKPYIEGEPSPPNVVYKGSLEVELTNPNGAVAASKTMDHGSPEHEKPDNTSSTTLVALDQPEPMPGKWRLRAKVSVADPQFKGTFSEVRLRPPQIHDIGWYTYEACIKIAGLAVLTLIGLALTFFRSKTN